jgi:hypothetical protein
MTDIRTYRQERDEEFLKERPAERWRCDIFPGDGTDHHGVGSTESMALVSAALHWHRYTVVKT